MKKVKWSSFLWIMFFVLPLNLLAQVKEIPITTKSKEALKYFVQGRDENDKQELASAAAWFDKAIKLDPDFARAYLYRSISGGNEDVFRLNLNKALSLSDKVSEGEKLEILSFQAWADGNYLKRKEINDQLLKMYPNDKWVTMGAGYFFADSKDYKNALKYFNKSAQLDNKYAPAYNMIGYTQLASNNYPEAEKAFKAYIKLRPNKADPHNSYAELLLKIGKYDESIAQFKKALEMDPTYAYALAGIGNNYIFKNDYEAARKYYNNYFDKASDAGGKLYALTLKAISYVHEGKIEEAMRALDDRYALAEKENRIPDAIYSVADQRFLLTETGNPSEGMKYCEKAIDLIGSSKLTDGEKESLGQYAMGWHIYNLIALGELDKSEAELAKYIQKYESLKQPIDIGEINFYKGYSELKRGNYDKAVTYYSQTDTIETPFNWYCTAVAYTKLGDKKNASEYFTKIAQSHNNSMDLALFRKRALAELKK